MVITVYAKNTLGIRQAMETLDIETSAIVYTDGHGVYCYDTSESVINGVRTGRVGDTYPIMVEEWQSLNTLQRQRIKEQINLLYNNHIIDFSENALNELLPLIDTMPLYRRASWGLQAKPAEYTADTIAISGSGVCCGSGGTLGKPLNDIWNNNDYTSVSTCDWGDIQFTQKAYAEIPVFLNLFQKAIDENLIEVSDELKKWVEDNVVSIPTDKSFHWDVYINGYKTNPLQGGYETQSIIVRWTCPAVNVATEEYLATNPEYEYRADNTLIELRADKTKAQGFTSTPFYKARYGELQTKIPMSKLSSVIGTSEFMKNVSEFIPSISTGDCYLYLSFIFENLGVSDYCIAQIPLNLTSQNTDHLYIKNGRYGSTVTIHYGEPEEGVSPEVVGWNDDVRLELPDDDFITDDNEYDFTSDISTNSNIGVLTTSYAMTESNLQQLGHKLWDSSFLDEISMINNSPIENIISCKSFGFPLSGESASVRLGNVDMNVNGLKISPAFVPIRNIGSFTIPKKFSGHLEWLNYQTNVRIYLPYIGFEELDISELIDSSGSKTITVKYIYDVITGVCTACLYADGIEISKYSGNMAIDIPITASNRAQVESGYITSALGALASLATGNVLGTIGSAFGAIMNQNHFTTKGNPSPSCDSFDEQKVFVIIDYPVYYEPTNYAHDYGYPCNMGKKLGNLKGFTKCLNVDVDNIICTENERAMIKDLLEKGVYL